ncbi:lipid II:glycine glycyltransferase FemX [Saccharicrinis aurantiacus]|uniref:lipid II:glycine glycyltransferase FemX n=1 Tax=Saccharicrinis aurantiacus TaxID=1849719 RepID=UPI002492664F|nr:GNAT family N-acetyltransferase [Saccharicrinis aurantiacus]
MSSNYSFEWTKADEALMEWDLFLLNNPRGHSQQISHYLKSYTKYPFFNYEVLIVRNKEGQIVAGIGTFIVGIPFLKVQVAPIAPIISKEVEFLFDDIISEYINRSKKNKTFYCELKAPILKEYSVTYSQFALNEIGNNSLYYSGKKGSQFGLIRGTNGFRSVQIQYESEHTPYELLWKEYNKNTKRNIKKAESSNLVLQFAQTESDIKSAYEVVEEIAKYKGFPVRSWSKMKDFLIGMVNDGLCIVPYCKIDKKVQGALIIFVVGQRLTYAYGGILRQHNEFKIGHFLHNEMLKYSIKQGYNCYDFVVGTSPSVARFKEGFGAKHIAFEDSRYWVNNKFIFSFWKVFKWTLDKMNVITWTSSK